MSLVLSAQLWFLNAVIDSRVDIVLRLASTLAMAFLVTGVILAIQRPHRVLWWAAVSAAMSVGFIALGAQYQGAIPNELPHWAATVLFCAFGALEIVCLVILVWRSAGARWAAVMFAGFCMPYALFSWFVAGMALSDTWI